MGRNDKVFVHVLLGLKDELVRAHYQRIALHGLLLFNMPQNAIQMNTRGRGLQARRSCWSFEVAGVVPAPKC